MRIDPVWSVHEAMCEMRDDDVKNGKQPTRVESSISKWACWAVTTTDSKLAPVLGSRYLPTMYN